MMNIFKIIISIIIITLNEADNLKQTILAARNAALIGERSSIPIEIIVSYGGSNDGTIEIAKTIADKVIISQSERFRQLNAGAKASKGDVLLFLHADILLPKGALLRIYRELKNANIVGGGFKKNWYWSSQVKRSYFLKFMNYWWQGLGNWLVRLLKTFPGDNAIFVRKRVFEESNGFSHLWICEDFDFIRRLKRYGRKRIRYIGSTVLTSTRRFERYGFFNTIFSWFFIY